MTFNKKRYWFAKWVSVKSQSALIFYSVFFSEIFIIAFHFDKLGSLTSLVKLEHISWDFLASQRDTQCKYKEARVRAGFAGPKLTLLLLPLVLDQFHSKFIIIMKARSEKEYLHRSSENTQTWKEKRKKERVKERWQFTQQDAYYLRESENWGTQALVFLGTIVKCK